MELKGIFSRHFSLEFFLKQILPNIPVNNAKIFIKLTVF